MELFTERITDTRAKITAIRHGEAKATSADALVIAEMPPKPVVVGKTAVPYINPQTKEIWYELVDRPLTQEEVLAQLVDRLEAKIDALSAAVAKMQGGAVEPIGKG